MSQSAFERRLAGDVPGEPDRARVESRSHFDRIAFTAIHQDTRASLRHGWSFGPAASVEIQCRQPKINSAVISPVL